MSCQRRRSNGFAPARNPSAIAFAFPGPPDVDLSYARPPRDRGPAPRRGKSVYGAGDPGGWPRCLWGSASRSSGVDSSRPLTGTNTLEACPKTGDGHP